MQPLSVLLIDDDLFFLNAIRRMLRRSPIPIELTACSDSDAFEAVLSEAPYTDIVICDYVMPEANGLQLLELCQQKFPYPLRILLTGDQSSELFCRAPNLIHAYIGKPFVPEDFYTQFEHAYGLGKIGIDGVVREQLGQRADFPICPSVLKRIRQLIDREASMHLIADELRHDPVAVAKVLQLANSAYLGFHRHTDSVDEAVARLGVNLITAVVSSLHVAQRYENTQADEAYALANKRSLQFGVVARAVASHFALDKAAQDMIFSAALLSDIGKLIILAEGGSQGEASIRASLLEDIPDYLCISAYVLQLWGFKTEFCELILNMERPSRAVHFAKEHQLLNGVQAVMNEFWDGPDKATDQLIEVAVRHVESRYGK